jgi:membrane-bound lytic murein transglycosylase D
MRKHGTRDYWVLVEKRALPAETRDYVGKVFAAAILAKDPKRYGFEIKNPQEPWQFEEVAVKGSVSFSVIARCAGVDLEAIETLNPMFLRGATPPNVSSVIRVPAGSKETFVAAFDKLPVSERLSYTRHTVASGEALGVIAERYGVSLQSIVEFNKLPNANRIRVGMELVIPMAEGVEPQAGSTASNAGRRIVSIRVKSGENLSTLALRHGVRRQDIIDWNQLSNPDKLQIGQELTLYGNAAPNTPPAPKSYRVKAGDSLYAIGLAQELSVDELKRWNGLSSNRIQPGQILKLGSD